MGSPRFRILHERPQAMSLYEALEDSAVHKAIRQQGSVLITVTDQAPDRQKQSHPDHFLIEWEYQDLTPGRTETADNRYGLWHWLTPVSPFDDWTPVSGGETKKKRKQQAMYIRLYAALEDSPVRMARLPYEVAGDATKRWITVIGGMKPPTWNREEDAEAFRIEYSCDGAEQPFCVKRVSAFSELPQALRPYEVQDGWSPVGSLEGMRAPDREEEWQHVAAPGRWTSEKPLAQALAESPAHAASLLFSSPDLITARWYLVTDNAPDRAPNLTVLYRYRVEWWDEGYEHYRSRVSAANLAAVASILAPASTTGDWRPVLTSGGQI